MKKNNGENFITPAVIISILIIILGLIGIYMSFYHAASGGQDLRTMLTMLFWQLLFSGILILIGVTVIVVRMIKNVRKSSEIREKLELLEAENKAAQELIEKSHEMEHIQRLEIIGTMTSGIAHEFNNMLTPIMGYSIMCMDMLPDNSDEILDNLTEIYEASSRAKTLISRLSSLSRKHSEDKFTVLSPDELLIKVEEVSHLSLPKNVSIVKDYNCPDECVKGDETQLGQVALNIVLNAIQAMKEKGGTLTISTRKENGKIKMIFSDNGPGIAEENLPKIFDPFFTTKETGQGTGLGLAIAQHIVSDHGGTIQVESKVGEGTVFTIELPACGCEKEAVAQAIE